MVRIFSSRSRNTRWAIFLAIAFTSGVVLDRAILIPHQTRSGSAPPADLSTSHQSHGRDGKGQLPSSVVGQGAEGEAGEGEGEGGVGAAADDGSWSFLRVPYPFEDGRRAVAPPGSGTDNLRSVFEEISAEILERWGPEYKDKLFSGGMNFSDEGNVIENKLLSAILDQGGFLAAFTGISISAGHDCLYEQSYPVLLNATMSRLMAATGVRFEAINVAMGNTRIAPYSFCVDAHAGLNADLVSWEMSMEVPEPTCGPAAAAVELFLRSATSLPRKPAVLLMDVMVDQDKCEPNLRHFVKQRNNGFVGECPNEPPERSLMHVYREFGLHHLYPSSIVATHTCGDERFARSKLFGTGKHYPRPMSWHPGPYAHRLVADMLFMHYAKVVMHAVDRLEEVIPDWGASQLRQLSSSSRISVGSKLRLWDEEDMQRKTRRLEEHDDDDDDDDDEDDNTDGDISVSVQDGDGGVFMGGGRGSILPAPVWCTGQRFCDGAGNFRCANTYFPTAGKNGTRLMDMVRDSSTIIVNRNQNEGLVARPRKGHWSVSLNEEKPPVLTYLKTSAPDGMHLPIDRKWVLLGDKNSGPIDIEFETLGFPSVPKAVPVGDEAHGTPTDDVGGDHGAGSMGEGKDPALANAPAKQQNMVASDSRVVVCKPDFIERIGLTDESGVRYSIDGVQTSPARLLKMGGLHQGSCVLLAAQVGIGKHTLTVEALKNGWPYVAISHVVYPA